MANLAESSDRNEASDGHQLGAFKQLQFHKSRHGLKDRHKSLPATCNRALPKPLQSWHNSVLIVTTAVHRLQATRHMRGFAMRQSLAATALPAMHPPARNLGPPDNKRQLIRQSLEIEEKRLNLKPTKVATVGISITRWVQESCRHRDVFESSASTLEFSKDSSSKRPGSDCSACNSL